MSKQHTPEPFGYFKVEPFGWIDCAETDEGAHPLYDEQTVDLLVKQRDELLSDIERCYKMLLSEPDTSGALFKAENILRESIASVKGGA